MDVGALFARHHAELFRYVARFTGDGDLAEDVVQDTFVRLAERPPAHGGQVRAWLFRVATTIAIDQLRAAKRRRLLGLSRADRLPVGDPPPDPAQALERSETRQRVRRALAGLQDKERVILLMREEGFAHREIAEAVGTATGSVGTMIARAMAKLASALDLDGERSGT